MKEFFWPVKIIESFLIVILLINSLIFGLNICEKLEPLFLEKIKIKYIKPQVQTLSIVFQDINKFKEYLNKLKNKKLKNISIEPLIQNGKFGGIKVYVEKYVFTNPNTNN